MITELVTGLLWRVTLSFVLLIAAILVPFCPVVIITALGKACDKALEEDTQAEKTPTGGGVVYFDRVDNIGRG